MNIIKVPPLLLTALLLVSLVAAQSAVAQTDIPTVSIRHISTAYANQGICSLRFGLGTSMGDGDAGEVSLMLKFIDPKGNELLEGEIWAELNDSTAGRYQEVFLEDQAACLDSSTRIHVVRATATVGEKQFNLLKLRKLVVDDFEPMAIKIPK